MSAHNPVRLRPTSAVVFALCLLVAFIVPPNVVDWIAPRHPTPFDWLAPVAWMATFLVAGAVYVVGGRRGSVGFALAFVFIFLATVAVLIFDIMLEDYLGKRFGTAVDPFLLCSAYPLAFGLMGAIGTAVTTRNRDSVKRAAASFALGGLLGGAILASFNIARHLHGFAALASFALSIALPGFIGARRFALASEQQGTPLQAGPQ